MMHRGHRNTEDRVGVSKDDFTCYKTVRITRGGGVWQAQAWLLLTLSEIPVQVPCTCITSLCEPHSSTLKTVYGMEDLISVSCYRLSCRTRPPRANHALAVEQHAFQDVHHPAVNHHHLITMICLNHCHHKNSVELVFWRRRLQHCERWSIFIAGIAGIITGIIAGIRI